MSRIFLLLRRTFTTSSQPATATTATVASDVKALTISLFRERNLDLLVQRFKEASEIERFRTRSDVYSDTVRRLTAAKRFSDIEVILEEQKKYGNISKESFNARLITLYGGSGMLDSALKVFEEMPERNCRRTVLSFNALLAACVNSKKFDKANALFRGLPEKLGIEPDLISYNTVIKAFREMGSLDLAVSCLDEMEKKGVEPDVITFNLLLRGFYGNGRFVDGDRIWSKMAEKNVVPNIKSYNAKLLGLAKVSRTKDGLELVQEMNKNRLKLDVFTFNAMIQGFVNENNLEEAKRWYGRISSRRKPNKSIFETLIPFVCEKGDFAFAFKLSKDIFNGRVGLVNEALLQRVVDGLVMSSQIEEAEKLVQLGSTNRAFSYNLKVTAPK